MNSISKDFLIIFSIEFYWEWILDYFLLNRREFGYWSKDDGSGSPLSYSNWEDSRRMVGLEPFGSIQANMCYPIQRISR